MNVAKLDTSSGADHSRIAGHHIIKNKEQQTLNGLAMGIYQALIRI
jgi:hypothetical protein